MIPIIVVRYKNPEVEDDCIRRVREYTDPAEFELVEIDNGIADENLAAVWNRAIADYPFGDDPDPAVVLLNTDAFLVDSRALLSMDRALRSSSRVGFVGPMTDNAGSVQKVSHAYWSGQPAAHKLGTPELEGAVLVDSHISGFCLMMRVQAWKDAGGFPEDAPFYGQESAIIEAAWKKDWHTVICLDAFVRHLGGATAKKWRNQDEERKKGAAWFRQFRAKLERESA